ncbi:MULTISPECIES: DUF6264 family protein [unclassified Rathayibacter]|uniref:DUF6264 family protein n=1 Tax=unclassified Rathayibacter TaxID=2609250 RepID=UPI001E2854B2|nr:DUF6264 family protein [Rathayibacter sp. Leaf294]
MRSAAEPTRRYSRSMTAPDAAAPLPPPGAAPMRPPASRARIADVTVSVVLLVAGVIGFALLAMVSLLLAMVSDGCFDQCDYGLMTVGWFIALLAPPVVFIGATVWTLLRIARRRTSWWMPLLGAVLALAIWGVGVGMMQASLGR